MKHWIKTCYSKLPTSLLKITPCAHIIRILGNIIYRDSRDFPVQKHNITDEEKLKSLRKYGFCDFESTISNEQFARGYGSLVAKYEKKMESETGKDYLIEISLDDCELARDLEGEILNRRDIQATIESYLGIGYFHRYTGCWYTPSSNVHIRAKGSQRWHFDHESEKQVKVFVVIDDCSNPEQITEFINAENSNSHRGMFFNKYPTSRNLEKRGESYNYKLGQILVLDTSRCLHRGGHRLRKSRYMFAAQFVPYMSKCALKKRANQRQVGS